MTSNDLPTIGSRAPENNALEAGLVGRAIQILNMWEASGKSTVAYSGLKSCWSCFAVVELWASLALKLAKSLSTLANLCQGLTMQSFTQPGLTMLHAQAHKRLAFLISRLQLHCKLSFPLTNFGTLLLDLTPHHAAKLSKLRSIYLNGKDVFSI